MTANDAIVAAADAEPGERLRRYETICRPRGGCRRESLINDPGLDILPRLSDGLRRLSEGGQSDPRVSQGELARSHLEGRWRDD
jgi:hypothetical protein